jgi:hypothetical protein
MIRRFLRTGRLSRRLGTAVAAVVVAVVGVVVVPSLPAAAINPAWNLIGRYTLDANGWIGDLYIDSIDTRDPQDGQPVSGRMYFYARGVMEYITGTFNPNDNNPNFDLTRQLGNGVSQYYNIGLGSHVPGHPVFGGWFRQSDQPCCIQYGVLANNFVPASNPPSWTPYPGWSSSLSVCWVGCKRPTNPPQGIYAFDSNGWSGLLYLPAGSSTASMRFDELGYWETVTVTWSAPYRQLVIDRKLSYGNVHQAYYLYLGDGPGSTMLGGFFTQTDAPYPNAYPAFALPIN